MGTQTKKTILRRYSDLPSLLHLLQRKKLTLLSPKLWDDKNDSYYIENYRKRRKLASVLALCFTEASETYHHWQVFSSGSSGICLQFDKAKLLSALNGKSGITARQVLYKKINELRASRPKPADYPFLKRYPFRDEKEFRIVFEDQGQALETKEFDIELSCISRISVNPWMPKSLFGTVKELIHTIDSCEKLIINRTTLVDNEEWKDFTEA
jgi:hypothetical protein